MPAAKGLADRALNECDRVRDLYRYYIPLEFDTTPIPDSTSVYSNDSSELSNYNDSHPPRSSIDYALTAFAQLTVLRLDCRRAFISLIDDHNQYILAEATKTLSLTSDDIHQIQDELILGATTIPRSHGVCETFDKPYTATEEDRLDIGDVSGLTSLLPLHQYHDVTQHETTKTRVFVKMNPDLKFMAEIPLRTLDGQNIGALTVMAESREKVTLVEHKFLNDVSQVIVSHLKVARLRDGLVKTQTMIKGMGEFMDGKGSIRSKWRLRMRKEKEAAAKEKRRRSRQDSVGSGSSDGLRMVVEEETAPSVKSFAESIAAAPLAAPPKVDPFKSNLPSHIVGIFARASNIIREAADLDGVLFINASVENFGGDMERSKIEPGTESTQAKPERSRLISRTRTELIHRSSQGWVDPPKRANRQNILAFSTEDTSSLLNDEPPETFSDMDEEFLQMLLRRYPQGKILYFDQGEPLSSSEEEPPLTPNKQLRTTDMMLLSRKQLRNKAVEVIPRLFPGVRCCLVLPLWDSHRERWYAGGFAYTTVATKIFTLEREFAYMAAFGNCIMAEVARYDAISSDRAKADFISSISHELRSPLHGILASVEFLQETQLDEYQQSLTQTVDGCSRTLLDCINHVLDFSKVRSHTSGTGEQEDEEAPKELLNINLASTVEEVVNGVYAGYDYKNVIIQKKASPLLFLDIAARPNWQFLTDGGAWKRIIMNVVGNALKYTETGWIRVHLSVADVDDSLLVTFRVTDTGIGIHTDFLQSRIFTPFAQENPQTAGTGLGLSLVWSMVNRLNGTVIVKSEMGVGTEVTVQLPLKQASEADPISSLSADGDIHISNASENNQNSVSLPSIRRRLEGKCVAFVGFEEHDSKARTQETTEGWTASIADMLRDWYGLKLVKLRADVDFIVVNDRVQDVDKLLGNLTFSRPNFIILCTSGSNAHHTRAVLKEQAHYVILPCGPYKLGQTLLSCLDGTGVKSVPSTPPGDGAAQLASSPSPGAREPPVSPFFNGPKMLLVEDNAVNMKLLEMFVKRKGFLKPHKAGNGLEALQKFRDESGFDVIFMDISMPIMNGIEATRAIRLEERTNREKGIMRNPARIIALTALASTSIQQEAYAGGVDLFLTKPVSFKKVGQICDMWQRPLQEMDV